MQLQCANKIVFADDRKKKLKLIKINTKRSNGGKHCLESHILQTCHMAGRRLRQRTSPWIRGSACALQRTCLHPALVCLSVNWSSAEHLLCLEIIRFQPLFPLPSPNGGCRTGEETPALCFPNIFHHQQRRLHNGDGELIIPLMTAQFALTNL